MSGATAQVQAGEVRYELIGTFLNWVHSGGPSSNNDKPPERGDPRGAFGRYFPRSRLA